MNFNKTCLSLVVLLASGCSSMQIKDFQRTEPTFIMEEYFQGKTHAWGMFEDRFGTIQRQFLVTIDGTWDGATLILNENFVYNDGEKETRVWSVKKTGANTYEGKTENVVGIATGESTGNAFNWTYQFNLKVGDRYWKVRFDDWMFLQNDDVLLNKAVVTFWGIKLGTVFLSFRKPAKPSSGPESS